MDLSTINELYLKSTNANDTINNEEDLNVEKVTENIPTDTSSKVTENVSMDANAIGTQSDSQSETLNERADIDRPTGNLTNSGLNFMIKTEPLDDLLFGSDNVIVIQPLDEEEKPAPSKKPKCKVSIKWRPLGKKSRRK